MKPLFALLAALFMVGEVMMGLTGGNVIVSLAAAIVLLLAVLYGLNRVQSKKEPIDYSQVKY